MKRRTAILTFTLSVGLAAVAQSRSTAADQHTHEGKISSGIYTNDFFEFSFEIPPGWTIVDNARYEVLNNKSREAAAKDPELAKLGQGAEINSPWLLVAEAKLWTDGKHHRMVRILSTDTSTRPETPSAEEFLNFVADTNRRFGLSENYVSKPESLDLGGRPAWKAYFNQEGTSSPQSRSRAISAAPVRRT